ncbi:hypothetical protein EON63_00540 [archaeon]|nr:MAG: hypothetical protein EON63_00540 [archaeon]
MSLQRELHSKYTQLASSLEDKYLLEIDAVVKELEEVRGKLGEAKKQVDSKEKEVHKMHEMVSYSTLHAYTIQHMRHTYTHRSHPYTILHHNA